MDTSKRTYNFFIDGSFSDAPKECLPKLKDANLRDIAIGFSKNFDDMSELAALPLKLAFIGLTGQREMMNFMAACMRSNRSATKYGKDPEATKVINDEMAKVRDEEETKKWISDNANDIVSNVFQMPDMRPTVRILLLSLLSSSWTLFEALSSDLWINLVNARPVQLGSSVIANLPDQHDGQEFDSRGVSLRVLAKHSFDLSKALGTLLSKRFDFTSLSGIKRAYKSAFPEIGLDIFDNPELRLLQAYRHVIVHRAGTADRSFIDTARLQNIVLGQPVPLEERSAENMINAAAGCGTQLISRLDDWLNRHPIQL